MDKQLGLKVATELASMGLTLLPKRFEIWFMHVTGEEPELTRNIEHFVGGGGRISDEFLDQLAREFLDDGPGARSYSRKLGELNDSSRALGTISTELTRALTEFGGGAKTAMDELEKPELDRMALRKIAENSIGHSRHILSRTKDLETELKRASEEIAGLRQSLDEAQRAAITDPLTGLVNRRHFNRLFDEILADAVSKPQPISVIMCDIDHFKSINDKWGHQTGDQVIQLVAKTIASNTKGKDVAARYGGEEFVVLLRDTDLEGAICVAETIRKSLEGRVLKKRMTNEVIGVSTMSFGVSCASGADTRDAIIESADNALYAAKRTGRNRVCYAGQAPEFKAAG